MFVFGVHIECQDVFDKHCLPGIADHGGRDATLITTTDLPRSQAYADMMEAAAAMEAVEAIILLSEKTRITDPLFAIKVTRALTADPALDVFGPERDGDVATDCLILRPEAPRRLAPLETMQTPPVGSVPVAPTEPPCPQDLDEIDAIGRSILERARLSGMNVSPIELSTTNFTDNNPLTDQAQQFQMAAVAWQGRAAHRITKAMLQRWREHPTNPANNLTFEAQLPPTTEEPPTNIPMGDALALERGELLHHIPEGTRRVLDVSCGTGSRGAAVKDRFGAHVVGIESSAPLATAARTCLDEVHHLDLNSVDFTRRRALPLDGDPFDVIVLAGTLERLVDPEGLLRTLIDHLADDGLLIATLPNVKHWSVILPLLLQDRFTYTTTGPIQPAHLRFYTMIEGASLLRRSGFNWCEAAAATTLPLADPSQLTPLLDALSAYGVDNNEARTLFEAYEFVLTARKERPEEHEDNSDM